MNLRPVNPKLVLAVVGPAASLLLGAAKLSDDFRKTLIDFFLVPADTVVHVDGSVLLLSWPLLIFSMLLAAGCAWFLVDRLWFAEKVESKRKDDEIENLKLMLASINRSFTLDVVTGIPRQDRLEEDFAMFAQAQGLKREGHLILLDIHDFSSVNQKFGFERGDRLLRGIVQKIHVSMRRDEEMYKKKFGDSPIGSESLGKVPLTQRRFYRKYAAGDEFLFLVRGDLTEALGFCNRLRDLFRAFNTEPILDERIALSFRCALAQVHWPDPANAKRYAQDALERVSECYTSFYAGRAAKPVDNFEICWSVNSEPDNRPEFERSFAFTKALEKFGVTRIGLQPR